jgi:flagellar basal body-associated protein FliL
MEILIILALVIAVILLVGYPLVNPLNYQDANVTRTLARDDNDLYGKREIVFEALRDLQFEFATGKLAAADYEQVKATYELQAAQILQQLDALQPNKGKNAQGTRTCPRCHTNMNAQDKFCTKCGAKL